MYNEYANINNIYTLNHEAYQNPIEVDDTTLDCIQLAKEMNEQCVYFDASAGSLTNLWHTYREESLTLNADGKDGILPSQDEIDEALEHIGWDKIIIEDHSISYTDASIMLDLGGIAKGYTTQLCKEELNKAGLTNGFINAGGNVVLLGEKEDGSDWNIGIQSPDDSSSLLSIALKKEQAIVTSGDYQRYFTIGDKSYNHIVNIKTGWPSTLYRSVTVITDNSAQADAYSTALFCLDFEQGQAFAKAHNLEVIWVFDKDKSPDDAPAFSTDSYTIYTTEDIQSKISI